MVPAGQVALMVNARFGRDPPNIAGGLHWRIYPDKPDASGVFRMLREERAAAPIFVLPPGGYVVHVSFGLATAAKKVQLRSETVRETFELAAGGARFEGRVGDSRIPPGQVTFDVFRGSQFEGGGGDQRALASNIATADVVLLPEGTYHVVSNYGNSNATVRSDIRVQAGKLTDVVVNHRAAVITLEAGERARRRGAGEHPVVGADAGRRRGQGGGRRLPQGHPGGRRVLGGRPQRGQDLQRQIQGGTRLRSRD